MQSQNAINRSKRWLLESVIKYQFCPYAKQPFEQDSIAYQSYTGSDAIALLETLASCCLALDSQDKTTLETTLLIIDNDDSHYLADFYDYLEILNVANDFLENPQAFTPHLAMAFQTDYAEQIPDSWAETYQIASFHPNYQFNGTTAEDLENFTNRSPYPIFHIIRNDSIEAVRMNDKRAEQIVENNIATIEALSKDAMLRLQHLTKPSP